MTLAELTSLILQLNSVVDSGLHQDVSLDEAKTHIEAGDVLDWLEKKFAGDIDLSLHRGRACEGEITDGLQQILGGYSGDEHKWGVEHNGICLLIAWVNQLVEQRAWKERERAA